MHPVQMSKGSRREGAIRKTAWQEADTKHCLLGSIASFLNLSMSEWRACAPRNSSPLELSAGAFGIREENKAAEASIGRADLHGKTVFAQVMDR